MNGKNEWQKVNKMPTHSKRPLTDFAQMDAYIVHF